MSLMGGYASYTAHVATLIHSTLLTTTHELCVTSSLLSFFFSLDVVIACFSLFLLLLLFSTTFSNAVPSRKHILAFVGDICCILYIYPTGKKITQIAYLKNRDLLSYIFLLHVLLY
jgi:hypothetical protein